MAFLLVSACLVGFRCRYDGRARIHREILRALEGYSWIAVCPEQHAGFLTPRDPIMFEGGTGEGALGGEAKVVRVDGRDLTGPLMRASRALTERVKRYEVTVGILKERSPSCGVTRVYIGETLVGGMGIFAAMVREAGVAVFSEETFEPAKMEEFL